MIIKTDMNDGFFECDKCNNTGFSDGFLPCNGAGQKIEPTIKAGWSGLFVCDKCGQIYCDIGKYTAYKDTPTLEVHEYLEGEDGFVSAVYNNVTGEYMEEK